MRKAFEELKALLPMACIEMALIGRKTKAARFAADVVRLERQVKYLALLTRVAVDAVQVCSASSVARSGLERNRALMFALAEAILTDADPDSASSLQTEAAALKEAHAASRAELLQAIVSEQRAFTTDQRATLNASLLSHVFLHALLALCGATDVKCADEGTAHLQLDSPPTRA